PPRDPIPPPMGPPVSRDRGLAGGAPGRGIRRRGCVLRVVFGSGTRVDHRATRSRRGAVDTARAFRGVPVPADHEAGRAIVFGGLAVSGIEAVDCILAANATRL